MIEESMLIQSGQLFKPHGYKGEINAALDYPEEFYQIDKRALFMEIDGVYVPFFLKSIRSKGSDFLLSFKDIEGLEEIKPFVNRSLYSLRKEVAEFFNVEEDDLDSDSDELIGFEVIDSSTGKKIGEVTEIQESVEYDYLVVDTEGSEPLLIPFIDEFIDYVNEPEDAKGLIAVNLPEGMLSLNES